MIEIFISYRRSGGEGWARDLHGELRNRLPELDRDAMFLDNESIELGAHFPNRLQQAITEAKITLAIIDPHWLNAQIDGRRRLDDPNDFVRREIEQSLARINDADRPLALIPVLCGGTAMPDQADLPAPLKPLAAVNAAEVRGRDHDDQLDRLARKIREILELPEPDSVVQGDAESLPYLCDRSKQDDAFRDLVVAHLNGPRRRRPLLCVVHGPAAESHRELVRRLANRRLRRCLELSERDCVRLHSIDWALPVDSPASFQPRFRERLVDEFGIPVRAGATDMQLVDGLKRLRTKAVVVEQTVYSHDLEAVEQTHFERQREYWADFPDLPDGLLVVSFVCLKYSPDDDGFISRWVPFLKPKKNEKLALRLGEFESAARSDSRVTCGVLPILTSARLSDVVTWANDSAVTGYRKKRKLPVLSLTHQQVKEVFDGHEELPMDDVGVKLKRLLEG